MSFDRPTTQPLQTEVATDRPFFRHIGYSTCWEDPEILREALQIKSGDVCLSVMSGGCNTLSLLLDNPALVVAVDFNPNQCHLLRLRIASFRGLDHGEKLELLGIRPSARRSELYRRVRPLLPTAAQSFWDSNLRLIDKAVQFRGRLERYITAFGAMLRLFYGKKRVLRFFACPDLEAQRKFYGTEWDGVLWRSLFDVFFSRTVMTRTKDRQHFRHVDFRSFGKIFRARTEWAFTEIPIRNNYFLAVALLGNYLDEQSLPTYLREDTHEVLRSRVERIEIINGDLERYLVNAPGSYFDKFNLSNILDWASERNFHKFHRELARVARGGARFCYWNTLLTRSIPTDIPEIESHKDLAQQLQKRDRSGFLYANFEVGTVRK